MDKDTRILDLGSAAGDNLNNLLRGTEFNVSNIYIADINARAVEKGARKFDFVPVVVDESGKLEFDDGHFDIVYCSSVIEHVTIPKKDTWKIKSGREFRRAALKRQTEFADEIRRIGKQYFVQTPYRYFPIESHSWLPFVALLPRRLLVPFLKITNRFWIKKTSPDWHLLNKSQLQELFFDADIVRERKFGLTKSIMAIKSSQER